MRWHEWSDEAFDEARERRAPVLLLLEASWCRWCRELEREVLGEAHVARLLDEHFVAIRVDKDRRPDIDARYSKGGWPTLAYLDDAGELIAADAYLEADALLQRLQLVAGYYAENREAIRVRLREAAEARETQALGRLDRPGAVSWNEIVEWVARTVLETSDPEWGGWGSQHKFPHPEAIDFALVRWSQTGDEDMRKLVLRTLKNMQQGEIHDRVEGGMYRYATAPDWSAPHYEKVLDSNAQRLYAYLEAYQALGDESLRDTAQGILRWMTTTLLDADLGAFRGSLVTAPSYARLPSAAARRAAEPPELDATVFTNWNAMAVSSLLKAATVLREPSWRERALGALEFLLDELFDERQGMHHYWDGTYHLPGMLTDQAYTLRALIDAEQHDASGRYLERAQVLAGLAIENLQSPLGAFYDKRHNPSDHGGLRRRNLSILENSVMAEALLRLSHLTRESRYAEVAHATLEAFQVDYKRYAHFVAGYGRAVDLMLNPPVHVTIVGEADRPDTHALQAAALAPYFATRVVQVLDPELQPALIERFGLPRPRGGEARAFVHRGRESFAETSDASRLAALMTGIERGT